MTKFQEITSIFNKWIGKQIDFDKVYWSQCVDWARQFAQEMRAPIGTFWGSAYSWWSTGRPFKWTKWKEVVYKPWMIPTPWDIIFFWPTQANPYWHVAIVDGGSTDKILKIVEQNAWTGNWDGKWGNAIKRSELDYNKRGKCLGWYTLTI